MRKLIISAAGAAVLLAAVAAVVSASGGPRLEGAFKVTGTVTDSDFTPPIPPGTTTHDTYKFNPTCASGGCPKVKLTRVSGGRNYKSTLNRIKPGVYKGPEGPFAYSCVNPPLDPGHFTGVNKINVTDSSHGHATKFKGTSKIKFTGCDETFENADVRGTLKN
jgi:hypothetical protein